MKAGKLVLGRWVGDGIAAKRDGLGVPTLSVKDRAMRTESLLLLPEHEQEELAASLIKKIGPGGSDIVRSICLQTIIPHKMAGMLGVTVNELELLYKFICSKRFYGFDNHARPDPRQRSVYGRGRDHFEYV